MINLFKKKKILVGFKLLEIQGGKETVVFITHLNLPKPFKFSPRKECDYLSEAIYGDVDEIL